jgi:hypothetical protein
MPFLWNTGNYHKVQVGKLSVCSVCKVAGVDLQLVTLASFCSVVSVVLLYVKNQNTVGLAHMQMFVANGWGGVG